MTANAIAISCSHIVFYDSIAGATKMGQSHFARIDWNKSIFAVLFKKEVKA